MNTKDALKVEQEERSRLVSEREVQRVTDHSKAVKDASWAMKELYPKDLAKIQEDIKKQAKICAVNYRAERKIQVSMPSGLRFDAYLKQLTIDLPGFSFRQIHVPGEYVDYGDFNAPCRMWSPASIDLEISWSKL